MSTPGSEPQPTTPAGNPGPDQVPQQPATPAPYPAPQAAAGYPGQPGYPTQNPPQGYPQQQWGAAPGQPYPAPGQPYPAPGQPYPAPGQAYPNGYPNPYQPVVAQPKNRWLGRIALIVVAACTVAATAAMGPVAHVAARLMQRGGTAQLTSEQLSAAVMAAEPTAMLISQIATWIGIAAAITGLVAAITGRGRAPGIFAVILGVFAPVIMAIYMVIVMLPYLS